MTTRSSSKRKAEWIASSFGDFVEAIPKKTKSQNSNNSIKNVINLIDEDSDEGIADLPWVEKYRPLTEEDLAVHKKKLQEVKSCLKSLFNNCNKNLGCKILLLTGPTGSAKTATLRVLKNTLEFEIKEWINPLMQEFDRENLRDYTARQESQSQLFHDFLLRANRYEQLSLFNSESNSDENRRSTIILVEDLPNFLLYDPKKMHAILREYWKSGRCPLVFIMSDSNADNFVNALFPKNLQIDLKITNISFNAIAFTSLTKSMNKIVNQEANECSDIIIPSKDVVELLATNSNGDIRSCFNSLQFYCTDDGSFKERTSIKSKRKTKQKSVNKNITKQPAFVGEKDTSLFLFRALGKILYSKRDTEEGIAESSQLPEHLKSHKRNKMFVDPEDVFERTQMSPENFRLYLQQNYPQFFTNIDDVSSAESYCSEADMMSSAWNNRSIMADYSVSLSMRGIMFSNAHPSSGGGGGTTSSGWKPMRKPQWFETYKTVNSRERFARQVFNVSRYSRETLFTEVLPYVAQYHNLNPALQEISRFPMTRLQYQKRFTATGDFELPIEGVDYFEPNSNGITDAVYCGDNEEDDDEIIEDFEDD